MNQLQSNTYHIIPFTVEKKDERLFPSEASELATFTDSIAACFYGDEELTG